MYDLLSETHNVHLDPSCLRVVESVMFKPLELKIAVELTIDPLKQVQVKSSRYTLAIVISPVQHIRVFLEITDLKTNEKWSTVGASHDIYTAFLEAFLDAVEYSILIRDKRSKRERAS